MKEGSRMCNFKKGDKVVRKNGMRFSNGAEVLTVSGVERLEHTTDTYIQFEETRTFMPSKCLELYKPVECLAQYIQDTSDITPERPESEHYHTGGIDVWKYAEANVPYDELFGFHRINVIKYVSRFGKKSDRNLTDLKKAKAYLEEMIRLEEERDGNI